jgi:hypothetical protein
MTTAICKWCGHPFKPRETGGKPQHFCRSACRRTFEAAGRRWVAAALAKGSLSLAELRDGFHPTRALHGSSAVAVAAAEGVVSTKLPSYALDWLRRNRKPRPYLPRRPHRSDFRRLR